MGDKVLQHCFLTVKVRKGVWDSTKSPNCANKITWLAASRQNLQWQIWLVHFNVADRQRVPPPPQSPRTCFCPPFSKCFLLALCHTRMREINPEDSGETFRLSRQVTSKPSIVPLSLCRRESAPCPFRLGFIDGPWCMRRRSGRSCKTHSAAVLWLCFAPPPAAQVAPLNAHFASFLQLLMSVATPAPPPPSSPHTASQPPSPT